MGQSNARVGDGLVLDYDTAWPTSATPLTLAGYSGTPVEVGEVVNSSGPNISVGEADVTNWSSNRFSDFLPTNAEGEISIEANLLYIDGDQEMHELIDLAQNKTVSGWRITFTDPGGTTQRPEWYFVAFLTNFSPAMPTADKMSTTIDMRLCPSNVSGTVKLVHYQLV